MATAAYSSPCALRSSCFPYLRIPLGIKGTNKWPLLEIPLQSRSNISSTTKKDKKIFCC